MKKETLPLIRIKLDGREYETPRDKYVAAKTRQLREFGYPNLTEKEVDEQIDAVKTGKKFGVGLTVIGGFIERDLML